MTKQELSYKASNGLNIKYKYKEAKYDFKHIIFVFSGFLNKEPGNYDFINALNECPADVIWIGDDFYNSYAYYLCHNMDFSIEDAVTEFIFHKINELKLGIENVTVTGFSKGGSAALYYGLKLNLKNIVLSVPQMKIGSYLVNHWHEVAKQVMGEEYTPIDVNYLDKKIIYLLKQEQNFARNIYLLTSEADVQYKTEIVPYLTDFNKYHNFNLLKTYSNFVREHNQVTSHHTALLLSIYYALASSATPRYSNGEVNFFGKLPISTKEKSGIPYVDLRIAEFKENRLFVEGVAILRGYDLVNYSDINYQIIFENSERSYTKMLAKAHRSSLTRELFDGKNLTIYDKGWFTTYQYKGLDISDIDKGIYQLSIVIKLDKHEVERTVPIITKKPNTLILNDKIKVYQQEKQLYLEIL